MIASLQDGIGYMQSEEVELSFVEALDFVIAEQANLSDSTTDPKLSRKCSSILMLTDGIMLYLRKLSH